MLIKHDNIFYARDIHSIGGVETYVYEMVKKYKDKDIAVVTKNIAQKQKERLKKYCRVYVHKNEKIECKVIITNWDTSIFNYVNKDAKCYTVLHTDYKNPTERLGLPKDNPRITYIGITDISKKHFEEITGIDRTILCRNPLEVEDKPLLVLMSATRLTDIKDNGRCNAIANELERQGINYIWFMFTSNEYANNPLWSHENVVHIPSRIDVGQYMRLAHWIIQPSICEGDSYTLKEALYRGKPIVVCELPYFSEIGIKNNENALFLKKDLSNIKEVVEAMKTPLKFNFKRIEDNYDDIIADGVSRYEEERNMKVKVRCIMAKGYDDMELKKHINCGDEFICDLERGEYLKANKAIEILEEIKEEVKKEAEEVVVQEPKKRGRRKKEEQ